MARSFPPLVISLLVWLCVALRACGDQLKSFSDLDCGILWFLHIPKTAGGSVFRYFETSGKRAHSHPERNYWAHYEMGWRPGDTTPVPKVIADLHTRLKETGTHGKPRILVREHGDNPSFSDFFPELLKLNKTYISTPQGRGCRLSMFTILRDPVDRLISEMHWNNRKALKVMTSADIRAYADSSQDFVIKFPLYGRPFDWRDKGREHTKLEDWPAGPATSKMVEKVKEMFSYFDLVGSMDQTDAIMDGIQTILGEPFPDHKFPSQASAHTNIPRLFNVTDSDMAYLCEVNKMDVELHRSLLPGVPQICDEITKGIRK